MQIRLFHVLHENNSCVLHLTRNTALVYKTQRQWREENILVNSFQVLPSDKVHSLGEWGMAKI